MMAGQASEYWLSSEDLSVDFDLKFDDPNLDIPDLLSIIEEKSDPPAEQEDLLVDFDLKFDGPSLYIDDLLKIIEEKLDPPAEQASEYWLSSEDLSVDFDLNFDARSMDIDELLSIIEDKSDPSAEQSIPEDLLPNDMGQYLERSSASRAQFLGDIGVSPSSNSEASDTRTGVSDGSSDSAGNSIVDGRKLGFQLEICSPVHSVYGSLTDWTLGQDNEWFSDRGLLLSQSTAENKLTTSGTLAAKETSSMEVAVSSNDELYARLSLCHSSDTLPGNWDNYSQTYHTFSFLKQDAPNNLDFEMLSHNDKEVNIIDEQLNHTTGIADSDTGIACGNWTIRAGGGVQQAECHMTPNFGVGEFSGYYSGGNQTLLNSGNLFSRLTGSNTMGKIFPQPSTLQSVKFPFSKPAVS